MTNKAAQPHSLALGSAEAKRWYILICFSLVSGFQSNTWFTFSSIPDQVEDYYHLHKSSSGQVNPVIDLLLNWGPIIFIPVTPFAAYLLSYPFTGLKHTVRLAATLTFLANLIRLIPTILSYHFIPLKSFQTYQISSSFWNTLIFLHVGQILNAAAGPLVMGPPTKLSVLWFPLSQRTLATGVAAGSNTLGNCIGYLAGPALVSKASDLPLLLWLDFFLACVPFICVWAYFPIAPTLLPTRASRAALIALPVEDASDAIDVFDVSQGALGAPALQAEFLDGSDAKCRENEQINEKNEKNEKIGMSVNVADAGSHGTPGTSGMHKIDSENGLKEALVGKEKSQMDDHVIERHLDNLKKLSFWSHLRHYGVEMRALFTNGSAMIVIAAGGMISGIFAAWGSVLQDLLSPMGLATSDIGWIGFGYSAVTIIGTLVAGPVADTCFVKRLKRLMYYVFVIFIIALIVATLVLPSPFSHDKPLIIITDDSSYAIKVMVVCVIAVCLGVLQGSLCPLFLELAAEVSYPVSEGTSATLNVFVNNVAALVFIGIGTWINTYWETILVLAVIVFCLGLLTLVKEQYKRL